MNSMTPNEVHEKLFEILDNMQDDTEPLFIGKDDEEPIGVLLPLDEYELMLTSIKFYSDPENMEYLLGKSKEDPIKREDIDWKDIISDEVSKDEKENDK